MLYKNGILKRITALLIFISMFFSILPFDSALKSFALIDTVQIYVDNYSSETLFLRWDPVPGIKSARLTFHDPFASDVTVPKQVVISDESGLSFANQRMTVNNIRTDYIYDLKIELFETSAPIGLPRAHGFLYFLPGVSFTAAFVNEPVDESTTPPYDPKGGREIGKNPMLSLKWRVPQVYNGSSFVEAKNALNVMRSELQSIYGVDRDITALDYRINISTNSTDMSMIDAVLVDGSTNKARVSGSAHTADIDTSEAGFMKINILGRASSTSPEPATSGYTLGHKEIYPGTVYYMNIQTVFKTYADAVYLYNGSSPLKGVPYTYTPIRFHLSKDDANNIYVKVYTINQGSLLLPDLYYEVQMNTTDSQYGWQTKAKIDPDYFKDISGRNLEFGIIPILNVSSNNTLYYRVVATSNKNDVIRSQSLPYAISKDTSRPSIPKGIIITDLKPSYGPDPNSSQDPKPNRKSTDVTIAWDKPVNWDEIINNNDPDTDLYYCFLLSTSPKEILEPPYPLLEDEDGATYPLYPAKYRLVSFVNARSANIQDGGNKILYTLKGLDMFKWEDENGNLHDFEPSFMQSMGIEEGYPKHLLSNCVYYLQMYVVKGNPAVSAPGEESQRSVTVSFTTLSSRQKDVPLPSNFIISPNGGNVFDKTEGYNIIRLQFDALSNINWADFDTSPSDSSLNKIYYDLYMSTDTIEGFVRIGSTEPSGQAADENNVQFEYVTDAQKAYISAAIKRFDKDPAVTSFGTRLSPNTAYYFKLKVRLSMPGSEPDMRESAFSHVLPVTTARSGINPPDPQERTPLAPSDFAIAKDEAGNLKVGSKNVVFNWSMTEPDVRYVLICTSKRLEMNATPEMFQNDPLYQDFKRNFSLTSMQLGIELDPTVFSEGFSFDANKNMLIYSISKWLQPNRIYYFSLRAERKLQGGAIGKASPWISIPVTTSMIQAPTNLLPVNDAQFGFYWLDDSPASKPEDFNIYVKGPSDSAHKLISRAQSTIYKDDNPVLINDRLYFVYFARIYNLKRDSIYSVNVYKGSTNTPPVYQNSSVQTRSGSRSIEIRWNGIKDFKYEIAIKASDSSEYMTLQDEDLEIFKNYDGNIYPYYMEKTAATSSNNQMVFYARIKSVRVLLPDGRIQRMQIKPNTKYDIKVRAVSVDTLDPMLVYYSKYAGPVQTRTEFDQAEYDKEEQSRDSQAKFLDRIKEIEQAFFWKIDMTNSSETKVLLKSDKLEGAIRNSGNLPFVINLNSLGGNKPSDIVYIPVSIIRVLNANSKSMKISMQEAEYVIRPGMLYPDSMNEIKSVSSKPGVKDVYLEFNVKRYKASAAEIPDKSKGASAASSINSVSVKANGMAKSYEEVNKQVMDRLYNSKDGLVQANLKVLNSTVSSTSGISSKVLDDYISALAKQIEVDLSAYLNAMINSNTVNNAASNITNFSNSMQVRIFVSKDKDFRSPYVWYDSTKKWLKISDVTYESSSLAINLNGTGKIIVMSVPNNAPDVQKHWVEPYIAKLSSVMDLSAVFGDLRNGFSPDAHATGAEIVLIYEALSGNRAKNTGMEPRQKLRALGLDIYISPLEINGHVQRQQGAAVVAKLYELKTGQNIDGFLMGLSSYPKDFGKVDNKCKNGVIFCVETGVMAKDSSGNFRPADTLTRAQAIAVFARILELLGQL